MPFCLRADLSPLGNEAQALDYSNCGPVTVTLIARYGDGIASEAFHCGGQVVILLSVRMAKVHMLYQLNLAAVAGSQRVAIQGAHQVGLLEKHVEEFFGSHINEIILEDQLMLIGQERLGQEEADLFALDRKGTLYIFEIKRWQSAPENLLQVLRYGQIFGRYEYEQLQDLARRHQKLEGNLRQKHREHFDLSDVLKESDFNQEQVFVVVTNGVDRDTLGAIRFWGKKGLRIQSLTYRLYSIGDQPYIFFEVFNPEQDVLLEVESRFFIVNTNSSYMEDAWRNMISGHKAAAYYNRKYAVTGITRGSTVFLYHNVVGIIAKGRATSSYKKADYGDDADEEYYIPLQMSWAVDDPAEWTHRAVPPGEINKRLASGHRFRQTAFSISEDMAKVIDNIWSERNPSKA